MHTRRLGVLLGMLGGLWFLAQTIARTQEKGPGKVELQAVKYDGLAEAIRSNRGKVVIVDFWADTCAPCKRAMPHLVELYHKHQKDGLAAITVAVDLAWGADPSIKDRLLKFLQSKGADFTNLVLDEPKEMLQNRLRVVTVPSVYVFNRAGKWTQFADGINAEELDALVKKLLAEK